MLRIYRVGEYTYQYEEGEQPEGAVLVDDKHAKEHPAEKAKAPRNKSKKTENK